MSPRYTALATFEQATTFLGDVRAELPGLVLPYTFVETWSMFSEAARAVRDALSTAGAVTLPRYTDLADWAMASEWARDVILALDEVP